MTFRVRSVVVKLRADTVLKMNNAKIVRDETVRSMLIFRMEIFEPTTNAQTDQNDFNRSN